MIKINNANTQEVLGEMLSRVKLMEHLEVETYSEPSKTLSVGFNSAVEKFVALIEEYQKALAPTKTDKQYPDVPCAHGVSVNEDCTDCSDSIKKLVFRPASEGLPNKTDTQTEV